MTTTSTAPHPEPATLRCGCCGRQRPAGRLTELGSTPGVYLCAGCGLWAARRASGASRGDLGRLIRKVTAAARSLHPGRGHPVNPVRLAIPVLSSADLDRTARYYAPLGFDVLERHPTYLVLHAGSVELHFISDPTGRQPFRPLEQPDDATAPTFLYVADAAALRTRLRQTGATGVGPVADQPYGLREFVLTDPDGNRVRIGSSLPD